MKITVLLLSPALLFAIFSCGDDRQLPANAEQSQAKSSSGFLIDRNPKPVLPQLQADKINTGNIRPAELLDFAKTLEGVPYQYGSINPDKGFDCSGFITYVFNHFGIQVPRSSIDFTHVQQEINLRNSKPGDLILFTGTDSTITDVGHMGIITQNNGTDISFIHSTSGKAYGVTVTPLNSYYQGRFVKSIRIFPDN